MNIGNKIKELRKSNNMSQKDLAQKLGVGQSTISEWENATYEPTASALKQLAICFDVSADYLLGLEDFGGAKFSAKNYIHNLNNNGNVEIK